MICPMCEEEVEEGVKSCGTCGFKLTPSRMTQLRDFFRPNPYKDEEPITIWKNRGHFSLRTTDIIGILGLVIGSFFIWFLFVLWIPYKYAGHRGAHIFIPLFILRAFSRYTDPAIGIYLEIATYAFYMVAWIRIHRIIKQYESK